jgi:hypothetical protein
MRAGSFPRRSYMAICQPSPRLPSRPLRVAKGKAQSQDSEGGVLLKAIRSQGTVVHTCNLSTQEADAEVLRV